jgi:cytoskeletal protein CcmA (bactofilin family)
MTTNPLVETRSEKGIALVVVLLLMAVLSGLATGFAMNGQIESAMAVNEVYYAGARAAAEAGMNRAVEAIRRDTISDLLAGPDGNAANTADNGTIAFMLTGASPYALDANGQFTYEIRIFDDDDSDLYNGTVLNAAQLLAMNENGDDTDDNNDILILRATGRGPSNTEVMVSRVLLSQESIVIPPPTLNPAILVNGDLNIGGNVTVEGNAGSVHANGNLIVDGASAFIEENATASGTFSAHHNADIGGTTGGGYANINVPAIHASDYIHLADFILHDDGVTKTLADGVTACGALCNNWTFTGGAWSITGNSANTGTFYVEGKVSISGSPKFTPENADKYQFITDGDFKMTGNVDINDPTNVEGQILVREQIHIAGNPEFQGRILVENAANAFNDVNSSTIPGTPTFTYNGTLGALPAVAGPTTYTNNVTGWVEGSQ